MGREKEREKREVTKKCHLTSYKPGQGPNEGMNFRGQACISQNSQRLLRPEKLFYAQATYQTKIQFSFLLKTKQ